MPHPTKCNPDTFFVTDSLGYVTFPYPCSLHSQADCAICHRLPGQCDHGTCQAVATVKVTYRSPVNPARIVEVRSFCAKHLGPREMRGGEQEPIG
jgi:hypothetical protein